ncbi:hypothetical protein GTY65_41660 [Streptomyces sp. SID8379]|uniref:hypothetical protein n=1 Tax=unclassified Streptomyces TaxID=2593676 RepID=UPI0003A0B733|nr:MULTISPECIES: hypothetical protein [unclassified Streptomyces]MYW70508.1 hypothetical protein [Streptomyces sp. SID8379]
MNQPSRLMTFVYGLFGRVWAYESVDEVRDVIARNAFDTTAERVRTHNDAAAKLSVPYALQPGLLTLHDELLDMWHELKALGHQAERLNAAGLTDECFDAANSIRHALRHVAAAAEETIPSAFGAVGTREPFEVPLITD